MSEKRFTVVIKGPGAKHATEQAIRNRVLNAVVGVAHFLSERIEVEVFEHNKTHLCDGCNKQRRDVKSVGKDSNGDPDAPDLCFFCRQKAGHSR